MRVPTADTDFKPFGPGRYWWDRTTPADYGTNGVGGGGAIRTHGTRLGAPVFKAGGIDRSPTPPHTEGGLAGAG